MKNKNNLITLIGMMGSGKTSCGSILAKKIGFNPKITLKDGIKLTMDWFLNSKQYRRYNSFTEKN